jgi:VMA21-like domain
MKKRKEQGGRASVSTISSGRPVRPFRYSASELAAEPGNRAVLLKLVFYTFLMFAAPLCTFFFVRDGAVHALLNVDASDQSTVDIHAAVASVISVNFVIAAYVLSAWLED